MSDWGMTDDDQADTKGISRCSGIRHRQTLLETARDGGLSDRQRERQTRELKGIDFADTVSAMTTDAQHDLRTATISLATAIDSWERVRAHFTYAYWARVRPNSELSLVVGWCRRTGRECNQPLSGRPKGPENLNKSRRRNSCEGMWGGGRVPPLPFRKRQILGSTLPGTDTAGEAD